jgi:hypothetical protein
MVCVNQSSRFEGIPDEKIAARRLSIARRRSEPKLLIFRSSSSVNPSDLKSLSGSKDNHSHSADEQGEKLKSKATKTRVDELRRLFARPLVHTEKKFPDEVIVSSTKVNFKVKQAPAPKEPVCVIIPITLPVNIFVSSIAGCTGTCP